MLLADLDKRIQDVDTLTLAVRTLAGIVPMLHGAEPRQTAAQALAPLVPQLQAQLKIVVEGTYHVMDSGAMSRANGDLLLRAIAEVQDALERGERAMSIDASLLAQVAR